ncbi:MAG: cyclopropane-fatty-acyl-phospholipid synthase family protein [Dehalococcoidia bacterium]
MEPKPLSVVVAEAIAAAESLGAIIAALQDRLGGEPLDPAVRAGVDSVLAAMGVVESLNAAPAQQASMLLDLGRAVAAIVHDFVAHPSRPPGWSFDDPTVLGGMGSASASFPQSFDAVIPSLPGLESLRAPGGRFLDVGVGVGALAFGAVRTWPSVRVTGIDIWGPSLAEARRRVDDAGLRERIELREQAVQDLDEVDTYDLAWFPGPFIPEEVVRAGIDAVVRSLKPGGWVVYSGFSGPGPLGQATADLRAIRFGGRAFSEAASVELLRAAGLRDARVLPPMTWLPGRLAVARKPV